MWSNGLRLALMVAIVCLSSSSSLVQAADITVCQSACKDAASVCRLRRQVELAKCDQLYSCKTPECKADYKCNYGCATCKYYWKNVVAQCGPNLATCKAACKEDAATSA